MRSNTRTNGPADDACGSGCHVPGTLPVALPGDMPSQAYMPFVFPGSTASTSTAAPSAPVGEGSPALPDDSGPTARILDGVMRTIQDRIESCLEGDPRCRNDDRHLYVQVLRSFYGVRPDVYTLAEFAARLWPHPDPESVRRPRAKIQAAALARLQEVFLRRWGRLPSPVEIASSGDPHLPTDPVVIEKRRLCEKRVRKDLGYRGDA